MALTIKRREVLRVCLANKDAADAISDAIDAAAQIGTSEIVDLAVTEAKLAVGAVVSDKIKDGTIVVADLADDSVETAKILDANVTKAKLAAGVKPEFNVVACEDAMTMSREENVAGLASCLALDASLLTVMNAHAADAGEHTTGADAVNFPVSLVSTDIADLILAVDEKITAYVAHNVDAQLGIGWAFHAAQQAGNDLASAVTPTSLEECLARLNDIKAKYNTHESSGTSHGVGSAHTEATADGAFGAANLIVIGAALVSDLITWSIINSGTGTVVGVSAVASAAGATITFDADPQNDTVISFMVVRATT